MGFFENILPFLCNQEAQPASYFEAASAQMEHYVHPVRTPYHDIVVESDVPGPRPKQHRATGTVKGVQPQLPVPVAIEAEPTDIAEATGRPGRKSPPHAYGSSVGTSVNSEPLDAATSTPLEAVHCTLGATSCENSATPSADITGSISCEALESGTKTSGASWTAPSDSPTKLCFSPPPSRSAPSGSGTENDVGSIAQTSVGHVNEDAVAGSSEAHGTVEEAKKKKKTKKMRKVIKKRVVTHYVVQPLELPPPVMHTPSTATVEVPTNTTLIMDFMDGVNRHLPKMASTVGSDEYYKPVTQESLTRQRMLQEERRQELAQQDERRRQHQHQQQIEQERVARMREGMTNGMPMRAVPLFTSSNIWTFSGPAHGRATQYPVPGTDMHPSGFMSQWGMGAPSAAQFENSGTVGANFQTFGNQEATSAGTREGGVRSRYWPS